MPEHDHREPFSLFTPENRVQLAKAEFCQALERLFGGDFKLWLQALKRLKAKGSVKSGSHLDALHELMADLEKLLRQKRRNDDER